MCVAYTDANSSLPQRICCLLFIQSTGSAYASSSYTSASISGGGNDCYLVCKFNHAIRDDDRKEWTGSGSKSISHTPTNVSANGNPDPVQSSRASAWDGEDEVAFDSWP